MLGCLVSITSRTHDNTHDVNVILLKLESKLLRLIYILIDVFPLLFPLYGVYSCDQMDAHTYV